MFIGVELLDQDLHYYLKFCLSDLFCIAHVIVSYMKCMFQRLPLAQMRNGPKFRKNV